MAFGSTKDLHASERFMLVRLTPGRNSSSAWTPLGGGNWSKTLEVSNVARVTANGVDLTSVSGTPTSGEFNFDESTKLLRINAATPSETTNPIIVFFHLFYTGSQTRYLPQDPSAAESDTNPLREWIPRLTSYPSITQTSRNITAGILSVSPTTIGIVNADNEFQQYLESTDSFSNKAVKIWMAINDTSTMDQVYNGKIKSVRANQERVTISTFDPFVALSQTAAMGDSTDETYFRRKTGSFPNLNPNNHDRPCPYILGSQSRAVIKKNRWFVLTSISTYGKDFYRDIKEANEAYCIDYNGDKAPGSLQKNNPAWGCCRVSTAGLKNQVIGSITRSFVDGGFGVKHYYISGHELQIGQTVLYNDGSPQYDIVLGVDTFQISGSDYNLTTYGPSTNAATSFTPHAAPSVFVLPPGYDFPIPLRYQLEYTYSVSATSGGNKFVQIEILRNTLAPEDNVWLVGSAQRFGTGTDIYINPDTFKVMYIVYKNETESHADGINDICTRAGLTVNAAALTQADSDLASNCRFAIPEFDQGDYSDYRYYAEKILKSTLGLLKINSSNEAVYEVIASPSSTDTVDRDLILNKSFSVDVDYNDVTTELIGYNPHIDDEADMDATTNTATGSSASVLSKHLHEVDKSERFRHVLDRIDNRIDDHVNLRSNRRARYKLQTATHNADALIGDDIKIEFDSILGTDSTVDVKITKITKTGEKTTIEAEDLEGL